MNHPTTLPGPEVPTTYSGQTLLTLLSGVLLRRYSPAFGYALAVAAFVVAYGLRLVLDDFLPAGFPFLTFFPAVLITTLVAGFRAGLLVTVLSGLASWYVFVAPYYSFRMNTGAAVAMLFYVLITGTELVFIAATESALRRMRALGDQAARLARGRELMLAEMQHRVSNNLATVAALLRAQAAQLPPGPVHEVLGAAQQRIMTVSRLQRRLHRHDRQDVELAAYLAEIGRDAAEASGLAPDVIRVSAGSLELPQDQALPLGLIVCELLLNAFEHAGTAEGLEVVLRLDQHPDPEGRIAVTIEDNGPGLPDGFDLGAVSSLGLSVARQFAEQMNGNLTIENRETGGTRARVVFMVAPTQTPLDDRTGSAAPVPA